jgi:hypothetical protein
MKVIYAEEALRDLDEILEFIESNYPTILIAFENRLRAIELRIGQWPKSAQQTEQRPAFMSFLGRGTSPSSRGASGPVGQRTLIGRGPRDVRRTRLWADGLLCAATYNNGAGSPSND